MTDQSIETLLLILEKEADFEKAIRVLMTSDASNELTETITNYLAGLEDLKSDFLLPARKRISEKGEAASLMSADKYWYFSRV